MQEPQLSSHMTGFYRFVFAPVWILGFGFGALSLLLTPRDVVFNGVRGGVEPAEQLLFLVIWVLGSAMLLWLTLPLRTARLGGDQLVVATLSGEVLIPLVGIRSVRTMPMVQPTCAIIEFDRDYGVGQRVHILVPLGPGWFTPNWFGTDNPAVRDLRDCLARRGARLRGPAV